MNKIAKEFGFVLTNNTFVPGDLFEKYKFSAYMDGNPYHREKQMREVITACNDDGKRPAVVVSKSHEFIVYSAKHVAESSDCSETEDAEMRQELIAKDRRIVELENKVAALERELRERSDSDVYRQIEQMQTNLADEIQRRIDRIDDEVNVTDAKVQSVIGGLVMEHGLDCDFVSRIKEISYIPVPKQLVKGKNGTTDECARIANLMLNLLEMPVSQHVKVSTIVRVKNFFEKNGGKRVRISNEVEGTASSSS